MRQTMRKWSDGEEATLRRMRDEGATRTSISAALGRSVSSIQAKIETMLRQTVGTAGDVTRVNVPESALVERARYLAAPPRDLTGFMLGDPPVGFSALERKKEPRAASVPVMGSN
jgi:hypothetical protein